MATGDQNDMELRLAALLPASWFQGSTPVLSAVLSGLATALAAVYSLISYVKLQTRIATASDGFLDMISADYFGSSQPRNANELDSAFRARILANLLRQKATRAGMIGVLTSLTGRAPIIFEPERPADTGAYGVGWGYSAAGGYGSMQIRAQFFVQAFRPLGTGVPSVAGYGISTGAYRTPSQGEYATMSFIQGAVTDAAIYAAVDATKCAGTAAWTRISS